MTREEELDWLCRLRSKIYVYMPKEWLIPMNNALDMAISDLSENKREWTPANDPPKKSGRYLAYIVNEYDKKLEYQMTADYIARPRPIEGLSPWCPDDECASDNVVAWMPLPEPYKAESEVKQDD